MINKPLIKRISSIVLIILGVVFGGTWGSTGVCVGDNILVLVKKCVVPNFIT